MESSSLLSWEVRIKLLAVCTSLSMLVFLPYNIIPQQHCSWNTKRGKKPTSQSLAAQPDHTAATSSLSLPQLVDWCPNFSHVSTFSFLLTLTSFFCRHYFKNFVWKSALSKPIHILCLSPRETVPKMCSSVVLWRSATSSASYPSALPPFTDLELLEHREVICIHATLT